MSYAIVVAGRVRLCGIPSRARAEAISAYYPNSWVMEVGA